MDAFRETCIALRAQGKTLTEIVQITGRPKTSVYERIKDVSLEPRHREAIQASRARHLLKFVLARKGKSTRPFRRIERWDENNVCLLSHILFDGDIGRGGCSYNNRNLALIGVVERAMRPIYDFEPNRYRNSLTGVFRISYFNVALKGHIEEMAHKLLSEIRDLPLDLKRVFLRSFFDDEGCIDFRPYRNNRKIRGYQKDVRILGIVQDLLLKFHITSRIEHPNEIVIISKENLMRFEQEIGFSPGVRINGRRSNSIWKQHLEKRAILRRAIESFKPVGHPGVHRTA